ncbi:MAG: GAF domain-containing protein [Bacteroidales bacterium]|nr:GAF domain-containing protein [Bacteroidales bacterium]
MKSDIEKVAVYEEILSRARGLAEGETDSIALMANLSALIHREMDFWWTGFYIVRPKASGEGEELVLGPFQGPVACTRIGFGRGVCGTAWKEMHTVIVPDVEEFPGHIACSSESRSEIVVPVFGADGKVKAVLDIDSRELGTFDETDARYLEAIAGLLS